MSNNNSAPFRLGERVVCVDDSPGKVTYETGLVKNTTYIVEDIHTVKGDWTMMVNNANGYWLASRFRPIDTNRHSEAVVTATELLKIEEERGVDVIPETIKTI